MVHVCPWSGGVPRTSRFWDFMEQSFDLLILCSAVIDEPICRMKKYYVKYFPHRLSQPIIGQ